MKRSKTEIRFSVIAKKQHLFLTIALPNDGMNQKKCLHFEKSNRESYRCRMKWRNEYVDDA